MLTRTFAAAAAMTAVGAVAALAITQPDKDLTPITVGVLEYGTAQWEMKVIKDHDLDEAHGIDLTIRPLAGDAAGDVALLSGEVDVILTDFVWVAAQRAQGNMITNVPHSLAVGGLMVPPDGDIGSVADLPGHTIGVAGGPLDKSWIALQAYYARETGEGLAEQVDTRFGAPMMINEVLGQGEVDAALNYWHYNARSKAAGMEELIPVAAMLEGLGIETQPPLLGWAFTDDTAMQMRGAVRGFLDASFAAKQMLKEDDAVWEDLRELMRAQDDDALFEQLRADYRAGIVTDYDAATIEAARKSFDIMAEYGGPDLVGDQSEMPEGTFWNGYSR
jgi:NitT/TauT family transport system substrate-binding protein